MYLKVNKFSIVSFFTILCIHLNLYFMSKFNKYYLMTSTLNVIFLGGFIYIFKNEVRTEILDKWQARSAKSKTIVLILHQRPSNVVKKDNLLVLVCERHRMNDKIGTTYHLGVFSFGLKSQRGVFSRPEKAYCVLFSEHENYLFLYTTERERGGHTCIVICVQLIDTKHHFIRCTGMLIETEPY